MLYSQPKFAYYATNILKEPDVKPKSKNCYKSLTWVLRNYMGLPNNQDYYINPAAIGKTSDPHRTCYRIGRVKHKSDLLRTIS